MNNFFSGFYMTTDRSLTDRERLARWLIEEASKKCPPVSTEVTDGMNTQYSANQHNIRKQTASQVIVGAEDRHNQHTSGLPDYSQAQNLNPACEEGDTHADQCLISAVHDLISASTDCIGPPIEACVQYLEMKPVGKYGKYSLRSYRPK
jgi:hypothetical protein